MAACDSCGRRLGPDLWRPAARGVQPSWPAGPVDSDLGGERYCDACALCARRIRAGRTSKARSHRFHDKGRGGHLAACLHRHRTVRQETRDAQNGGNTVTELARIVLRVE